MFVHAMLAALMLRLGSEGSADGNVRLSAVCAFKPRGLCRMPTVLEQRQRQQLKMRRSHACGHQVSQPLHAQKRVKVI